MPKQYPCDICEQAIADFAISSTATGETQLVCVRCLPAFTEAVVSAVDALMAEASSAERPAPTGTLDDAEGWEYERPEPARKSRQKKETPANGAVGEVAEAASDAVDPDGVGSIQPGG
jgi:hypothetical protein